MRSCDTAFVTGQCDGHLGKFDSCRDEALYDMSMLDDAGTGNVIMSLYAVIFPYDSPRAGEPFADRRECETFELERARGIAAVIRGTIVLVP